ncbi:TonB-dependent receptor [Sphingomonas sp. BK235]|uniref:TonB-dependent receptor n=1 Tax=Sphingomonas sp. BK235 TaxID=2512131 RepID=UPI00104B388C|nr:TonB-dependent receptor [Sphingomonas sp. BK235]TCP31419.1 outer membrane receptor protein involved in Fe transport [Sphingomonas sp. BK235]
MRARHISIMALAIAWAGTASAQQAPDEPQGDEIIVTGEKANRTLQETPTSVAVTTPERIRQENILTIQDIYNRTANVAETYGAAGFTIRGINNQGVGAGGNADTATVYVDGAPIPREALFGGPTDLWDIRQVEILRGPQSTIQGLNALAGAIVLTTRDAATSDYSGDARVLWSEYDDRTFSAAVGGPLVTGELGFRLSAEHRNDRGLIRNVTRGGYDDALESLNLRGKLKWTPSALPGLEVQGSYNRVRRDGGYLYEYARTDAPSFYRNRTSTGDAPSRGHIKTDIAVLNAGYDIAPGLRLTSITSYNKTNTRALIDTDGTAADLQVVDNTNDFRTWTQEMRLNYVGDRLSGVVGAWAYRRSGGLVAANRLNITTPTGTIAALLQGGGFPAAAATQIADLYTRSLPVIPVAYAADSPQSVRTAALFADARYRLTDQLSLIGGFRYDHEANRYTAETVATFTGTLPSPAAFGAPGTPLFLAISAVNRGVLGLVQGANSARASNARSFDAFLPKAGISMDWTPDLGTTFTVQRAYRSGGSSQNPARALLVAYDPEYSWNYVGSLRSRWWDGKLTLNANVFYIDWKDQQTNAFFGLNEFDYNTVNAGTSHLYGFEIESQARISRAVDAYASVGHVRTKFDDFSLPGGATSAIDLSGSEFPYAARWTIAGGLNTRVGPIVGNLNANYRGPVYTDVGVTQSQGRLPGRTVVNARIGWEVKQFTLFAFARNLLNEEYQQYDFASSGRAILGDPQTFGGGVEAHF